MSKSNTALMEAVSADKDALPKIIRCPSSVSFLDTAIFKDGSGDVSHPRTVLSEKGIEISHTAGKRMERILPGISGTEKNVGLRIFSLKDLRLSDFNLQEPPKGFLKILKNFKAFCAHYDALKVLSQSGPFDKPIIFVEEAGRGEMFMQEIGENGIPTLRLFLPNHSSIPTSCRFAVRN